MKSIVDMKNSFLKHSSMLSIFTCIMFPFIAPFMLYMELKLKIIKKDYEAATGSKATSFKCFNSAEIMKNDIKLLYFILATFSLWILLLSAFLGQYLPLLSFFISPAYPIVYALLGTVISPVFAILPLSLLTLALFVLSIPLINETKILYDSKLRWCLVLKLIGRGAVDSVLLTLISFLLVFLFSFVFTNILVTGISIVLAAVITYCIRDTVSAVICTILSTLWAVGVLALESVGNFFKNFVINWKFIVPCIVLLSSVFAVCFFIPSVLTLLIGTEIAGMFEVSAVLLFASFLYMASYSLVNTNVAVSDEVNVDTSGETESSKYYLWVPLSFTLLFSSSIAFGYVCSKFLPAIIGLSAPVTTIVCIAVATAVCLIGLFSKRAYNDRGNLKMIDSSAGNPYSLLYDITRQRHESKSFPVQACALFFRGTVKICEDLHLMHRGQHFLHTSYDGQTKTTITTEVWNP